MATSEASGLEAMAWAWYLPQAPKPARAKRTEFMKLQIRQFMCGVRW